MKANQYNAFKQIRQTGPAVGQKPASAFITRSPQPMPDPYSKPPKETNFRAPLRDPEDARTRQIRTPTNTYGQLRNDEPSRPPASYFHSKRPNSINNVNDDPEAYKTRGIAVTAKSGRPASGIKRQHDDKFNSRNNEYLMSREPESGYKQALGGSSSHGRLIEKFRSGSGSSNTPKGYDQRRFGKDDDDYNKELSEYQKLHEKLNSLENKIADMKSNLEKKRVEKETILEKEQRDRKQREAERNSREKLSPMPDVPKYKRNVPPELNAVSKESQKQDLKNKKQDKQEKQAIPKAESALKGIVTQVPKQDKQLHSLNFNPYSPRHNLYYVSEITRTYQDGSSLPREHVLTSMHILKFMESVKRMTNQEMAQKMVSLPKKDIYKDKKTVVFDLDETLIHCNENTSIPYDIKLPITFPTGQVVQAGINIRPYAFQLLKNLSRNFQIIVFTASHSCYANVVLDHLDPKNQYIQHRLYREHCCATAQGMYVKDLRVINRSLSDMVLIDNAAYSYAFQLDNGIPIVPYYEGRNDFQLKALQTYLEGMVWVKDVREVNRNTFKLQHYKDYQEIDQLVKELYGEWIV